MAVVLVLRLQVIGVEPSGANSMAMSLAQGRRVTLSRVDAFADGVAVKHVSMAPDGCRRACCMLLTRFNTTPQVHACHKCAKQLEAHSQCDVRQFPTC